MHGPEDSGVVLCISFKEVEQPALLFDGEPLDVSIQDRSKRVTFNDVLTGIFAVGGQPSCQAPDP